MYALYKVVALHTLPQTTTRALRPPRHSVSTAEHGWKKGGGLATFRSQEAAVLFWYRLLRQSDRPPSPALYLSAPR